MEAYFSIATGNSVDMGGGRNVVFLMPTFKQSNYGSLATTGRVFLSKKARSQSAPYQVDGIYARYQPHIAVYVPDSTDHYFRKNDLFPAGLKAVIHHAAEKLLILNHPGYFVGTGAITVRGKDINAPFIGRNINFGT